MATFCYECVAEWKSEETCIFGRILAWSCSDFVEGIFWIPNPKQTIKFLYDDVLKSKWRKVKLPIYRFLKMRMTSLWRHFLSNIFENLNLASFKTYYHHTKFCLVWSNRSKVALGGTESLPPPPPPVENVINHLTTMIGHDLQTAMRIDRLKRTNTHELIIVYITSVI